VEEAFQLRYAILLATRSAATSCGNHIGGAQVFRTDDRQSVCGATATRGYKVDCAVATTYSLDFVALTAIVAAITDCSLSESDEWSGPEVARAILGLKRRVVVFVNQGPCTQAASRGATIVMPLRSLRARLNERRGIRPKMWLVKYAPKSGNLRALPPDLFEPQHHHREHLGVWRRARRHSAS
jgi:hypothetical protein